MPFTLTRNRIIIIFLVLALIAGVFIAVLLGKRIFVGKATVSLTVWGVFDDNKAMEKAIALYKSENRNLSIQYVNKAYALDDAESYEKELLDALASGKGPDIFMFHNTWLPKHIEKIAPLNEELQTALNFPFVNYRDAFPKVIEQDFVRGTTIYASPLYLDTLALFYNKDFFDKRGVALLPATWGEFESLVNKIKEVDAGTNNITKAGAAIGGSEKSINRATDLLSLMMLQRGVKFTDSSFGRATFASIGGESGSRPGLEALKFYTQFANPNSPLYTWNERLHYSIDSFASGDTAAIFNYAHQIPVIKSKNPFLNFGVSSMPQLAGAPNPVNYANYWGLAVSNQSKNIPWAWQFILSATTKEKIAGSYAEKAGKPPALRTLIDKSRNDPELGVFVKQALTASSWPQIDNVLVETAFSDMIDAVVRGQLTPEVALNKAADEISAVMRKKQ
ncbi:MAG: extracellular solute-binding protein [Candidatus Liptonbacteria bacterium]|nr:extracellular solute-binding protein [Candidatus Liptonbacteria bacterium]